MEAGGDVIAVSLQDGSGMVHHNAVVTQAVLDQIQQQVQVAAAQQQQHHHQDLILATPANSSNAVTIQEPQRGIEMIEFFRKQRVRDKFCDVVLHVHGKHFYAHRMVLAAGSAYFDSIFKSKKTIRENLSINCQDPEVFQMFLNYFYTGSITLDKSNIGELIRLSNHFLVVKLKGYCAEFLERFLDPENCLHVKKIGERFRIPSLAKAATNFIQTNLGEVINHEIMMELPPKEIENFVTEKAWGLPQEAALRFMSRWVCHDLATRERDFKQLLTNIDWTSMDSNVIVDYIDQEPLYGSSERCFFYVLNSLAEKLIHIQKYEQIYLALQQRFGQEMDPAIGFGENLLQMAFNSAMEGLSDTTSLLMGDVRENPKWVHADSGVKPKEQSKLSPSLELRRRKILAKIQRNRLSQRWVRLHKYRPRRPLRFNEMVDDSSGDEECDPIQTAQGYRCHLCPFSTKKVSRLERHLSNIHAHDVTYRCSECGFMCKWNRDYFLHMKSHYEGPPYKCHLCDYQCQKIGSLIAHKVTHVELKPYQCCDCSYRCRSKANLAAHMKCHNNEKPYRCSICGRTFASKNALDQHAVAHNTDKIYSCTQCQFTTKFLNHFTNHKKTHQSGTATTSIKKIKAEMYRCHDSSCKYTTTKKSQLDSHMRSHAGVRPHVCSICGRRFLEKSHLVRHERIHFNERPFKCEECDYASTRRDKLKEHKSRHHGVNASAKSPYKPRPHKGGGKGSSSNSAEQPVVYAKKSTVPPPTQTSTQPQQQPQEQSTASPASGDLEFIIPHTHMGNVITSQAGNAATTSFGQLVGNNQGSIDLQQMANTGGIVLRPFQAGKSSEIQVAAQTLASIPTSISAADLQRTLGVKIEDLQGQGVRTLKLEELGQVGTIGQGTTRIGTMVLDAAQLQQLAAAAAAGGGNITIAAPASGVNVTATSTNSNAQQQQQTSNTSTTAANQSNNQSGEFSGISSLMF